MLSTREEYINCQSQILPICEESNSTNTYLNQYFRSQFRFVPIRGIEILNLITGESSSRNNLHDPSRQCRRGTSSLPCFDAWGNETTLGCSRSSVLLEIAIADGNATSPFV